MWTIHFFEGKKLVSTYSYMDKVLHKHTLRLSIEGDYVEDSHAYREH